MTLAHGGSVPDVNVPPRLGGDLAPTTVREREAVEMLRGDA